jgi:hypothetical protein
MCEIERLTRDMSKIEASVRVFVLVFSSSRTEFESSSFLVKVLVLESSRTVKNLILKFLFKIFL